MPRVFYEDEITQQEQPRSGSWSLRDEQDEYNVSVLSDADLTQLMERYKEKLQRYTVFLNEEFERTERKILIVHQEQVKRFRMKTNNNI